MSLSCGKALGCHFVFAVMLVCAEPQQKLVDRWGVYNSLHGSIFWLCIYRAENKPLIKSYDHFPF